jgi:crotonobetainyl-CoA:carnitine CoA-transferase CaiB-like acyl-CoA transferase
MNTVLKDLRVIALAHGWAGPLVGQMLGDFGADVIKVESCQRPDWLRTVGLIAGGATDNIESPWEWGTTFNGASQSMRGITLDLNTEKGREIFLQLVRVSDVVVENYAPRVLPQLGITYDTMKAINPSIILLSMPAFGNSGSLRDYVGLAQTTECMGGVAALCGYDGESPILQASAYADPLAGITGAMAVLMAVRHRRKTGKGQHIDLSHVEAITSHIGGPLMDYAMNRRVQPRRGNASSIYAPHGCYRTAGEDSWITIAATTEEEWQALCITMQRSDLTDDPRYNTVSARLGNKESLDSIIEGWTLKMDKYDVMRVLQAKGVPAGPVLHAADLLKDDHLMKTEFFVPLPREHVGIHRYAKTPIHLSKTPGKRKRSAPTLGEHNREILRDLIAIPPASILQLEEENVIGYRPVSVIGK